MPVPFNKPATSITEQIAILRQRGLIIKDPPAAEHYLKHVGYYRLAGYWQIFQNEPIHHIFIPGTTIEEIIELYNFDRELRLLLLDAIEFIEVSFRSVLVNEMCTKYGPTWFANPQYAFREDIFDAILQEIDKELERSKEDFIAHHDRKYGSDKYPPAWKTMQALSFGTLSKIYGNIHNNIPERRDIAKTYGLPTEAWVHSWMQVVSVLRNYCAHHGRLCYRIFNFPPKDMHRPKLPWIKVIPQAGGMLSQHLYYQLCAVRYLLHTCSPDNIFNNKLKQLIARYPRVELNRMGFMPGWEKEDLWK
jgi:abortive infection bacteriophage resistance protein